MKPRLKRRCFLVKFADAFIIGCELEADARRVLDLLKGLPPLIVYGTALTGLFLTVKVVEPQTALKNFGIDVEINLEKS